MEENLTQREFDKLVLTNKVGQYIVQTMRLNVKSWEKKEIDKVLYLLRQHNKGLVWRYEKIPPKSGE